MSSTVSPFVSALPLPRHTFFEYDEDGDVIMTDAVTGMPVTYGTSDAYESVLDDERPSKRSRSSSDESVSTIAASPVPARTAAVCPPAPARPPAAGAIGAGAGAVRNLAEAMAEAVLEGEPRDPPVAVGAGQPAPPLGGEPAPLGGEPAPLGGEPAPLGGEPEGWCASITCADLALRLDMRHPRVVLDLLRFVTSYNELAPEGEEIHLPYMGSPMVENILSHHSLVHPPPEFAHEIAELRVLIDRYRCHCPDCCPEEWSADGYSSDGYSSDGSGPYHRSRRDRGF
jgi:hypothetical protein